MPRYEYRCSECRDELEIILPMARRDAPGPCACGGSLERRISLPMPAASKETGRDHTLATLNKENGHDFPCTPRDRPRMEAAYAKGLYQTRPVIGVGI